MDKPARTVGVLRHWDLGFEKSGQEQGTVGGRSPEFPPYLTTRLRRGKVVAGNVVFPALPKHVTEIFVH